MVLSSALLSLFSLVHGETPSEPNTWQRVSVVYGETPETPEQLYIGLYTTSQQKPGVFFKCTEDRFRATFSTKGIDFRAAINDYHHRIKPRSGSLYLDGAKALQGKWYYLPVKHVVTPDGRKFAAKTFNAVIKGQTVSFNFRGIDETTVDLPPVDDAFRAFNRQCKELQGR